MSRTQRRRKARKLKIIFTNNDRVRQRRNAMREAAAAARRRALDNPTSQNVSTMVFNPPRRIVSPDPEYDPVETSIELARRDEMAQQIEQLKMEVGIPEDESISLHAEESLD
jgi:hypothetical protein